MTGEQISVLAVVASVLTFVLRIAGTYLNVKLGRLTANILLFVIAGALAFQWSGVVLPTFSGNPAAWITALFAAASPIVALASLIYNALYTRVVVPLIAKLGGGSN